ncbi:undecaprenyl-phosphate glucose phosphotransferase [Spiribacter vilamensis]|uniref:Putative colanic acid biosynthesis UDP-glucose lipid carrier transferase n=1 Tax=Spiribacter vilamensis TaxID=531306 RepID=A0A4V6MHF9_9GAMM|nr:undecaprenyl-phosphate glucose phosphotransferase [Spiribacter vilamensis]RZU98345.1 putative colanic acid biosynthesis UDP-glucose lipid carrier transferase [Spiribacter vilamensis]
MPLTGGSSSPRSVFLTHSLSLGVIAGLQWIMPALLTVVLLYGLAALGGVAIDSYLTALAIFAAVLTILLIRVLPASGTHTASTYFIDQTGSLLGRWLAVLGALLATAYLTGFQGYYPAGLVIAWAVTTPVAVLVVHWLLDRLFRHILVSRELVRTSVIAGGNELGRGLAERIRHHPEYGFRVRGFFDDRSLDRLGAMDDVEYLGRLDEVSRYVREYYIDVLFIVLPMRHIRRVMRMLDELSDSTVSIYYVPDFFVCDLIQSHTADVAGVPVVSMWETPFYGYRGILKRVSDVALTLAVLVPALPVMAIIALLIRLTSRGPAIFRQQRYGLDGRPITVYKFRSMHVLEDGDRIVQAWRGDPRVTSLGRFLRKTSLDELPQLFNVLQGRMSLVGPRPHAVAHNEEYRGRIKGYMLRHKVLPGITGLAQVNGCRGETSDLSDMEERIRYDLEYLKQWTPLLDLKILFRTGIEVIKGDRAY